MDLISEIKQSGDALRSLVDYYIAGELPKAARAFETLLDEKKYRRYIFTGMGSSDFAALPACRYLRERGIDAQTMESGEFFHFGMPPLKDTLVIAISQSGNSAEVVALCEALEKNKCDFVTVTNYESNSMHSFGTIVFPILAGPETKSSSKTYTNTIALLLFIAKLINRENDFDELGAILRQYANDIEHTINMAEGSLSEVASFLGNVPFLPVIGSGTSYATASQAEILIMEISQIASARYTCGQFMHGTVELLSDEFYAILLDFQEETREEINQIIKETLTSGGKLWLITDRDIPCGEENMLVTHIAAKGVELLPLLSPIIEIEPIILLTAFIAEKKGLKPGVLRTVKK